MGRLFTVTFIYTGDCDVEGFERSVWYECETCIVTNVAVTVTPTQAVKATVDFVTSGPITLREVIYRRSSNWNRVNLTLLWSRPLVATLS